MTTFIVDLSYAVLVTWMETAINPFENSFSRETTIRALQFGSVLCSRALVVAVGTLMKTYVDPSKCCVN